MAQPPERPPGTWADLLRFPDLVRAFGADGEIPLRPAGDGVWAGEGAVVGLLPEDDHLAVRLRAGVPMTRLHLRWTADLGAGTRYLGDAWERAYGDLEWRGEVPERVMPWYLLTYDGERAHGYGVRTGAGALCFWTADRTGLSLWADVRSGGQPVRLGDRALDVCDVVCRAGEAGESPYSAGRALCRQMCPAPRLPGHVVRGTNDWHVAYGDNSFELISAASEQIASLAGEGGTPYSVIDDGWSRGGLGHGPWYGNQSFGDMGRVAERLSGLGVRPGLWYRPLTAPRGVHENWRLAHNGCLDPSRPDVLELVADEVCRMVGWGYRLIKHDFTTWDVLGRWGPGMGATIAGHECRFADGSLTTAEVLLGLYRVLREAAGDALLLGCNTIGHLAAGLVELQRIGDDTSGRSWSRTRRMGVNALAFRAVQHGTFFAVDPDVAPVTPDLPTDGAMQWLELVGASGMPLFVSVSPDVRDAQVLEHVRRALASAASAPETAEPLDWLDTVLPTRWRLDGRERTFRWMEHAGGDPLRP
jgi:alpha-galactosidase